MMLITLKRLRFYLCRMELSKWLSFTLIRLIMSTHKSYGRLTIHSITTLKWARTQHIINSNSMWAYNGHVGCVWQSHVCEWYACVRSYGIECVFVLSLQKPNGCVQCDCWKLFDDWAPIWKFHFGCLEAGQHVIYSSHLKFLFSQAFRFFWSFSHCFFFKPDWNHHCGHISARRYCLQNKATGTLFPKENNLFANTDRVLAPIQNDAMHLCFYFHLWQIWSSPLQRRVCVYAVLLVCQRSFETRWQKLSFKISIRSMAERCSQNCNLKF